MNKNLIAGAVIVALVGGMFAYKTYFVGPKQSPSAPTTSALAQPAAEPAAPVNVDTGLESLPGDMGAPVDAVADAGLPELPEEGVAVQPTAAPAPEPVQQEVELTPVSQQQVVQQHDAYGPAQTVIEAGPNTPASAIEQYYALSNQARLALKQKEIAEANLATVVAQKDALAAENAIRELREEPNKKRREAEAAKAAVVQQAAPVNQPLIPPGSRLLMIMKVADGFQASVQVGQQVFDLKKGQPFLSGRVAEVSQHYIIVTDGKRQESMAL